MNHDQEPRVLDVGQCDLDHGNLCTMLTEVFHAQVDRSHTCEDAITAVRGGTYDLVLVNRILDRDGSEGTDVIQRLQADPSTKSVSVMIISNYAEAQATAVSIGARQGFGKDAIHSEQTRMLLGEVLVQTADKS